MYESHPNYSTNLLADAWDNAHFAQLDKRHLRYADIVDILNRLANYPAVKSKVVGHACSGTPITRLTLGTGPLTILAWTQMHGDEATATAAVLDWLHILLTQSLPSLNAEWQNQVTLHVIPMLNPDGAEQCTRVNAQGIDINRDAKARQTPEGQTLWHQVAELRPDLALNLHDQNSYYTAGHSGNPATIAFLAPAYHADKHVDGARLRAKQIIACMAAAIQHWLPEHIGRYDDTYSLRSFGDNIAATGCSTILIESGAYPNDPNRQMARKMNVVAMQTALEALISQQYQLKSLADYYHIPENVEDGLVDIKYQGLRFSLHRTNYSADISVNICRHTDEASIQQIGDLSVQNAFTCPDVTDMKILPRQGQIINEPCVLTRAAYKAYLTAGIVYFIGHANYLDNQSGWPVLCVPEALPYQTMYPNSPAFWLMQHAISGTLAVLNGKLVTLT